MKTGKLVWSAALVLLSSSLLIAADVPTTQPMGRKAHGKKLTSPWTLLKTLTPEQTSKIEMIHADAVEQKDKIEAKEHDDIAALLTPEQVTELKAAEEKQKMERKEKAAEKKKMATTEPVQ